MTTVGSGYQEPRGVAEDSAGNIFVADRGLSQIFKIDPAGSMTTYAGIAHNSGYTGDGGPAISAAVGYPYWLSFDAAGDLLFADENNDLIRAISPSGIISTVAGYGGNYGYSGDGGPATSASFEDPVAVAGIPGGGFVIADDFTHVVRKVNASGIITTLAGNGTSGYSGDGGLATSAQLAAPSGVAVDAAGDVFIADTANRVIRKVDPTGIISTIAGNHTSGYSGDGGPATSAQIGPPTGVAVLGGYIYVDGAWSPMRRIDPSGIITTVSPRISEMSQIWVDSSANILAAGGAIERRVIEAHTAAADLLNISGSGPQFPGVGQQLAYSFTVANPGTLGGATGVTLTDPLPAGTTYVSSTASQGSCTAAGRAVTCALGSLAAGGTDTVSVTATAPSTPQDITNTATVSANETDPAPGDNSASVTSHVGEDDLSISQTVPSLSHVNQPSAFSMTVASAGPATGVVMKDTLPSVTTFVSAQSSQGTCSVSTGTVTCMLGAIADGGSVQITITATPTVVGPITNTATVSAAEPDINPANNSASATSYVNPTGCGEVITASTKLTADIGPCQGDGVIIGADSITLNLNGHSISGLGQRGDDVAGIRLPIRSSVTIENGSVTGFAAGILVNSGGGNTIAHMNVHDNLGPDVINPGFNFAVYPDLGDGIFIEHSAANKILSSTITHNGTYDGIGIFGLDSNFNLVQGNTVSNNVSLKNGNDGVGIELSAFLTITDPRRGNSLYGNNIIGNTIVDNQGSGISNVSSDNDQILNNDVERNGLDPNNAPDNGIGLQADGAAMPATDDTVANNTVIGNGWDGIQVVSPTFGNTITNNTTNGNNVNQQGFADLEDQFAEATSSCGPFDYAEAGVPFTGVQNFVTRNTYGSGGVLPSCLASTNQGPTASTAAPPTKTPAKRTHIRQAVDPASTGSPNVTLSPAGASAAPTRSPSGAPSCGSVITANITLTTDMGPCQGPGLVIGADNITVDLGGHNIVGGGTNNGTNAGVYVLGHQGVTVRHGSISNFDAGVVVYMGASDTLSNLNVHDNIGPSTPVGTLTQPFLSQLFFAPTPVMSGGIEVFHSFGVQVLNNTVTHNGVDAGIGIYGVDSNSNVVKNNTVTGTVGSAGSGGAGIMVTSALEPNDDRTSLPIDANNVLTNTVTGNQGGGIVSISNINALIQSNAVQDNGVGTSGTPRDGIQLNFDAAGGASPGTTDTVLGNTVSGNGDNGIAVYSGGNTVKGNSASGDNVNSDGSFDLFDSHPTCDHNTWLGNTSGSAGASPTCT